MIKFLSSPKVIFVIKTVVNLLVFWIGLPLAINFFLFQTKEFALLFPQIKSLTFGDSLNLGWDLTVVTWFLKSGLKVYDSIFDKEEKKDVQ